MVTAAPLLRFANENISKTVKRRLMSCTAGRTTVESLKDFADSFTSGDATKDYVIYPIWIGSWYEIGQPYFDSENGWTYAQSTQIRKDRILRFLNALGSTSWFSKLYQSKVPKITVGNTRYFLDVTATDHKLAIQGISSLAALNPSGYSYNFNGEAWLLAYMNQLLTRALYKDGWGNTLKPQVNATNIFVFMADEDTPIPWLNNTKYLSPTWYSSFCGTHTYGNNPILKMLNLDLSMENSFKAIYVPYPSAKSGLKNCIPSTLTKPPSGDAALDSMINTVAHELVETITGYDIMNQCVYNYGTVKAIISDPKTDAYVAGLPESFKYAAGAQYTEKVFLYRATQNFYEGKTLKIVNYDIYQYYYLQQIFNPYTQTCMNG